MSAVASPSTMTASGAAAPHFLIGQDRQGFWLAVESHDRGGGLFASLLDALRFADGETGHRPGGVEIASQPLQLRF